MEELNRKKEKFMIDGEKVEGYVIDDRNYGTELEPTRFIAITKNGKLDGVMVLYELHHY